MNMPFSMSRRQVMAAALALAAGAALAQPRWPRMPIRIVVGFGAGSTPDLLVRLFSQELAKRLGQTVLVENRPGATGNIAADLVAKSAPDGYTLIYGTNATHAINPSLYSKLTFDHVKDFQPITLTVKVWNVLLVNPQSLLSDFRTLVALARTRPGQLTFASGGNGSSLHLTGELLKQRLGLDIMHIPYKTVEGAVMDLAGGRVDMLFANIPSAMPHIQSGRLKAIAVTSRKRLSQLADVPSLDELGLKDFEVFGWGGLFAPAKTPGPIVERLHREMVAILTDPAIAQKMEGWGATPQHSSPAEFGRFVRLETVRWREVIRVSGARMD
jgi:tripartite-type tricarboxylate transporter receptor subunit TctC